MTDNAAESLRYCHSCGAGAGDGALFCSACGTSLSTVPGGQSVSGGRDVHARDIIQGTHVTIHNPGANFEPEPPGVSTKWTWRSPLTQAALAWLSALMGVASLFAGYQGTIALIEGPVRADGLDHSESGGLSDIVPAGVSSPWLLVFAAAMVLMMIALMLHRIARHQLLIVGPSFLPALIGWGRRIGLAKLVGACTKCGARLHFYNKPTEWIIDNSGSRRVTKRQMVAECEAEPEYHVWPLDRTTRP
ncbi:zinc ribbon domain-containing protein [Agromyces sp. H66]|uniref:zinc ribbon domain-containing protein n=1 Tax=Agromyces sp. H66 TaxID=2529859 RepID=UPI0010AA9BD2|nr:zinc ribbon domain-containing protein [Agromyces sp. H66]